MRKRLIKALDDKDFAELFKKGGVSFLLRVVGQSVGFLFTFIIAHYFGPNGLGKYVLAIIVLRVFVLFAKLGTDTAMIRLVASFASKDQWASIKK